MRKLRLTPCADLLEGLAVKEVEGVELLDGGDRSGQAKAEFASLGRGESLLLDGVGLCETCNSKRVYTSATSIGVCVCVCVCVRVHDRRASARRAQVTGRARCNARRARAPWKEGACITMLRLRTTWERGALKASADEAMDSMMVRRERSRM